MKYLHLTLGLVLSTFFSFAQAPNKMTYQSVVRDGADKLLINTTVGLQISILQGTVGGTAVYVETFQPTTNANGLLTIEIGTGTVISGNITTVDWNNGPYFIKSETDPGGGTSYTISGTSELLSVPYAFMSQRAAIADSVTGGTTESDPIFTSSVANSITATDTTNWNRDNSTSNELQILSISNDTLFLSDGGFAVLPAMSVNNDNDSTNELQSLTSSNDTIYLSDGGFAVLPVVAANNDNDSTNELQLLSISNDTMYLSDGGFAVLPAMVANNDNDSTNELQMLSISNDTVYLSNGGFAVLPATTMNNDNDSTNEIQMLSTSNDTIYLSNGGFAILPAMAVNNDNDSTNEFQSLSASNDTIYLSDGGFAVLPAMEANNDNDSTNELQMLTISNDTVYLSNGGFVVLPGNIYDSITHGTSANASGFVVESKIINSNNTSNYSGIQVEVEGTDAENTGINAASTGTSLGTNIGLRGTSAGGSLNYGLYGSASGGGMNNVGTYGVANSTSSAANSTNRGVTGEASSATAIFNQGVLGLAGPTRNSTQGYNAGLLGEAFGHSELNYGMLTLSYGTGNTNYGGADFVYGNVSGAKKNIGSYAYAWGADTNMAIRAYAKDDLSAVNYGIYSEATGIAGSLAGRFLGNTRIEGNLVVTGSISKGSGTFKIDHPQDPENKFLIHSFVESPDMMNVYNGNATTDGNGFATVELPDYVESANKDFRYQLTPIGQFAQCIVSEKVSGNKFVIQTDKPNVEVSWMITGIRNDPYSNLHRIEPVVGKNQNEKGKYLHPEAYDKDDTYNMYPPADFGDSKKELEMLKKSSSAKKNDEGER